MTASDDLILPVQNTSQDQVQARYGECFQCMLTQLHFITIKGSETGLPAAADFTGFNS